MTNSISNPNPNDPLQNIGKGTPSISQDTLTHIAIPATSDTVSTIPTSGFIPLRDYLSSVAIPTLANQQQVYANRVATTNESSDFYIYISSESGNYILLVNNVIKYNNLVTELNAAADTLEALASSNFTPEQLQQDQNAVADLNAAIAAYNADPTPENLAAYEAAAADYQAYVDQRNQKIQEYNAAVKQYNALLDTVTKTANFLGLDTSKMPPPANEIPTLPPAPPAPIPPATITPVTYPVVPPPPTTIDTSGVPNGTSLFPPFTGNPTQFSALYTILLRLQALFAQQANRPDLQRVLREIFDGNSNVVGLQSFVSNDPVIVSFPIATTTGASGAGASISNYQFPFNLSNPNLARNINQAVTSQERRISNVIDPSELGDNLAVLVRQAVEYSSTSAIIPTLFTLLQVPTPVTIPSADSTTSATRALLALNAAQKILNDVKSNALQGAVTATVNKTLANNNLSPAELDLISANSLASVHASLLNTALILQSEALQQRNLPQQVYRQVLNDLNVNPTQAALITARGNANVNQILANPITPPLLQNALLQRTNEFKVPVQQAAPVIANAVRATVANAPYTGPVTLEQSALANLRNASVNANNLLNEVQIATLAHDTAQFVNRERTNPNLNAPLPAGYLSNIEQQEVLRAAVQTPNVAQNTLINTALTTALNANPATVRGLRETFTAALQPGLGLTRAQNIAQNAVNHIEQQIAPQPPFTPQNVQRDVLHASLANALTTPPAPTPTPITPAAAQQIAVNAATTALNNTPPPSNANQLRTNLQVALVQQGIPPAHAREAASNTFITTVPSVAPTNAVLKNTVKNQVDQSFERLAGVRNEKVSQQITNLLVNEQDSLRAQLRENLHQLQKAVTPATDLTIEKFPPVLGEPIHMEIQDSFYKQGVVFNALDAPEIITGVFRANPNFGVPKEAIDLPPSRI